MEKFWFFFWRLFGIALAAAAVAGVSLGIIEHSLAVIYSFAQRIIAIGMGICGIIGLVVVPIEMYITGRKMEGD